MSTRSGFGYFRLGFFLIRQKGLGRYVLIPLLINILVFMFALFIIVDQFSSLFAWLGQLVPEGLGWLHVVIDIVVWPLTILLTVMVFAMLFGTVANWLAAPFNGLLAEKTEAFLRGVPDTNNSFIDVVRDIPRTLFREWEKLKWYLPRAIGFLLLLLFLPVIGQLAWFLFGAWMMSVQYCDYPFDNHKIPFTRMREALHEHRSTTLSFGIAANLMSMLPIVNFLVMPVAVCGATAMWVEKHANDV